jgi:hypothetical protein
LARVDEVVAFADACAVIGDLFLPGATLAEVTERARLFHAALGGAPRTLEARP